MAYYNDYSYWSILVTTGFLLATQLRCCTSQNYGPSTQPEAYFNGSSYMRLQTAISLKKQITGISFRTCFGGNLFSQQHNDDLIELSVIEEGVTFVAKAAGKQYEEIIKGRYLDNRWHDVYLKFLLGNLTMEVDGVTKLIANSSFNNELLTTPGLYNEGAAILLIGKHFKGCILEGPSIVFDPTISSHHNVEFTRCPLSDDSCVPKEHVKETDYCLNEPCMKHGTCINGKTSYTCVCPPRFTGKNCDKDAGDPCLTIKPCNNSGTCISDALGGYNCKCPAGFAGKHCEFDNQVNTQCLDSPCLNGGTCEENKESGLTCVCPPGFTGVHCETNLNECDSNPCKNRGICIDGVNNFTCACDRTGYTGRYCEVNINECRANPCLNHGTCFDTYGGFTCQCHSGFAGKNCQLNVNECQSQPCLHQGTCIDNGGGYECHCSPGYSGQHCENKQVLCDSNLCPPYADCVKMENADVCVCKQEYSGTYPNCVLDRLCYNNPCENGGSCLATKGGYNCTCTPGFTGAACETSLTLSLPTYCQPGVCLNGGNCVEDPYNKYRCYCPEEWGGPNCETHLQCKDNPCKYAISCQDYQRGYYCTCEAGWTGVNCNTELDLCSSEPCLNGATCIAHVDFYTCTCPLGFTGKNCERNYDECITRPCLNGGQCIDKINGFYCNCTEQWMGMFCEKPFDACEFKPCKNNGNCTAFNGNREFVCSCLPGFAGENCEVNVDDCLGVQCAPGKICMDLINKYECRCPPGFAGDDCTVDLDPCAREPCKNGAVCEINKITHDFTCVCPRGYQGENCTEDIDECKRESTLCNKGICVNSIGSYQCYCMPGYTGEHCDLDFNECLSMPCKNNATCLNKINNYECECPPGFTGKDCSIDINECDSMPCKNGATCKDEINNYTCICELGLTGRLCDINIDDCEPTPCMNGAPCIDGLNNYTCNCEDTGYAGRNCEINIDDCAGDPCTNGGRCIDEVKNYRCDCYAGYTGKNCEEDINECESSPCQYSGMCLQKSNITLYDQSFAATLNMSLPEFFNAPFDYANAAGYECLCVQGVIGKNCEININECESSPCIQGTCIDKIGGYICECEQGFEGEHCDVDIDECEKYEPCKHGKCMDRRANYYCDCDPNYGGKNCSVELIGCTDEPCFNNGTCRPYLVNETDHKFNCSCPNGYYGNTCEDITTMSLTGKSIITVNTSRDEGYDIQFRFKTTLGDGLLALGKGVTYYILELSKGRLNLHSSLLNKWEGVFIGSNLNDSNWQKVFVAINSTHLVLSANDEQTIYPITLNENSNIFSTSFPVTYIGGAPSNLRKLTHSTSFVGCTEDFLINGEWVLPDNKNNGSWLTFQNVSSGCLRQPQCDPNPCHSGGLCTDMWRDFSCKCERPYLGHTCHYNYTAATFGYENITDSLVTVSVADSARRAVRTIVDISMFIRTRQSKGQIFYLGSPTTVSNNPGDETYIAAQLEGGELLVRIQFNGTPEAYTVGGVKLDNGYNHLIEVIRNVTLVQVKLNGTEYFRKTISATGTLDAQVLFLGGQPQVRAVRQTNENMAAVNKIDVTMPTASAAVTAPLSNVHFKGIIQDVQISNGSSTMVVEFFPLKAKDLKIPTSFGLVSFYNNTVLEGVHSDDSCRTNPCQHNGICENTWNDYRCNCTHGFKGKDCAEKEFCEIEGCPANSKCENLEDGYECLSNATFTGTTDPLIYRFKTHPNPLKSPTNFDTTIEIHYRTKSWGTIFFAKNLNDYFVVFIYHNEVVVQWRIQSKVPETQRFKKDHFEGQWLQLYFTIKDNTFRGGFKELVMDEAPNFEVKDFNVPAFAELFQQGTVYVAGSDMSTFNYLEAIHDSEVNMTGYIPITSALALTTNSLDSFNDLSSEDVPLYKIDQNKTSDKFKGCLSEIRIGGLLLPFFTAQELYKNLVPHEFFELDPGIVPDKGCVLCFSSDCYNHGICASPQETFKCNCKPGYTAFDCSIDIDECKHNQCQNNATCIDMIAEYTCNCLPGFTGDYCETDINECESNPCRHNGVCQDLIGTFRCSCPPDFVGKQCEAPLLITCDNQPCGKGATCSTGPNELTGNNFTCICSEGMEGPLCDTAFCITKHCEQGSCNTTQNVPYCTCLNGFTGKYCEININDCKAPTGGSPCQNGGVCIDGIERFDCNCSDTGYTGLLCEMDIDECETNQAQCGKGTCKNLPGTYRCICDEKYMCGHHCNLTNPCEIINPCIHGSCEAQCTEFEADYLCTCVDSYVGKNCTELKVAASHSESGLNILYIIIPIVLIIIIGLAIGLAVLVNVARSKRATRGTYSPSAQEFCNPRVELDHVLKPPPEERLI